MKEMDAHAIVVELEDRGIISNGDQTKIRQETNPTQQNQLLHACLKKKGTVEALMVVCDIITEVKGNPKLKCLGEDMRTELEKGLSYVGYYAYMHLCVSWYAVRVQLVHAHVEGYWYILCIVLLDTLCSDAIPQEYP